MNEDNSFAETGIRSSYVERNLMNKFGSLSISECGEVWIWGIPCDQLLHNSVRNTPR